jgi:RNA polymerase sigma-70 factor (ECF subfamily)
VINIEDEFESHRRYLFAVAYRMLSSVSDAEDIVQDAYLRYLATPRESVLSPRAFLTTIVTRLCLNHLQSARVRRETYVGPWLPEPLRTDAASPPDSFNHVADKVEDDDSISMAFLILLERLTPVARAVFLLREVFDYEYREIAEIVERDEAACRQTFSRARKELASGQRRFNAEPAARERILRGFMQAVNQGDMHGLTEMLSDDVELWADGGGRVRGAATRPIHGSEPVATFLTASRRFVAEAATSFEIATINGEPGIILREHGAPLVVMSFDIENKRIRTLRLIANPDKLSHIDDAAQFGGDFTED